MTAHTLTLSLSRRWPHYFNQPPLFLPPNIVDSSDGHRPTICVVWLETVEACYWLTKSAFINNHNGRSALKKTTLMLKSDLQLFKYSFPAPGTDSDSIKLILTAAPEDLN